MTTQPWLTLPQPIPQSEPEQQPEEPTSIQWLGLWEKCCFGIAASAAVGIVIFALIPNPPLPTVQPGFFGVPKVAEPVRDLALADWWGEV